MNTKLLSRAYLGLVPLLFIPCTAAHTQQAATGSEWIVGSGPTLVQINAESIHINQPNSQEATRYAVVSKHVMLPAGKPWKVTFEVRFGELRSAGTAVGIFDGDHALGWVGADGWYKQMGCFVGKDNEVAQPPVNADWHRFEFSGDGAKITVSDNGSVVGSASESGTPSLIKIGDIFDAIPPPLPPATTPPPGQQTELWVRSVTVRYLPKTAPANDVASKVGVARKKVGAYLNGTHTRKRMVAHRPLGTEHHRVARNHQPAAGRVNATYSLQPDGINIGASDTLIPPNERGNISQPSEELRRAAEDYQDQVTRLQLEKASLVARYNAAIVATQTDMAVGGQQGKIATDEAKAMSQTYDGHLRDLVISFAAIRTMPGYATHYVETGWVFDEGDTEGIPGVSGLRNIAPR